jgi:hypothetical protein
LENGQTLFSQRHGLVVPDGGSGNVTLETAVPAGPNTTITGGLTLGQNNTIQGIHLGNATGPALSGPSVGTATMNTQTSGAINNTTGGAMSITTGTLNMAFTSVSSSGGTNNVLLSGVGTSGTLDLGSGTLSGATSDAFKVSGASGSFSYSGTISNTSTLAVNIENKTGGTVTLSGDINPNTAAKGISVSGNNTGTNAITFSGANKKFNTGTGTGVNLSNNTGATISFTNGGLDIDATSGTGFNATGGGTIVVATGANPNTIDTTTGTALNVANTTIGASGLTFRSISSGAGANNGISLVSTGAGGLTVTGLDGADAGSDPDAGSGGTITGKTGADGSTTAGTGVFLSNANNVSLNGMTITNHQNYGIRGSQVDGFRMTFSLVGGVNGTNAATPFNEGSVSFIGTPTTGYGLRGSVAFLDNEITGGFQRNVSIDNATGTMNLNFLRNNVHHTSSGNSGDDGFAIEVDTSAVMFANVSNNTFTAHRGDHFNLSLVNNANADLTFTNNDMQGGAVNPLGQGVLILGATYNGTFKYDISNNGTVADPFTGNVQGGAIHVNKGSGTGTFSGRITNNVIGDPAVTGSGSAQAFGIIASARGAGGSHTTLIHNNMVRQYFDRGIVLEAGEGSPTFNATVTSNTVSNFADATNSLHGIHFEFGILNGDNAQITTDVRNNLIANAGNEAQGGVDFRMRAAGSNDVFVAGCSTCTTAAGTQTFIDGQNPDGTSFSVSLAANGTPNATYNNGPASPLPGPNLPTLPPAP